MTGNAPSGLDGAGNPVGTAGSFVPAGGGSATPAPTPTPVAGDPWHKGLDANLLTQATNKGWDISDPAKAFAAAAGAYQGVEKLVGANPQQLVRWPDKPDSPEWADIKTRLGVPPEAAQYDFSGVKFSDGTGFGPEYAAKMQEAFFKLGVPKDMATGIAAMIAQTAESEEAAGKTHVTEEMIAAQRRLDASWGMNKEANMVLARMGFQASGLTQADVDALDGLMGKDRVLEHFRKIGVSTQEGRWIAGNPGQGARVMTVEEANTKQQEMMADPKFAKDFKELGMKAPRYNEWAELSELKASAIRAARTGNV